jgi:hypothetical protein
MESFWLTPRNVALGLRRADGHVTPIASRARHASHPPAAISDTTPVGVIVEVVGSVTMEGHRWRCVAARAT